MKGTGLGAAGTAGGAVGTAGAGVGSEAATGTFLGSGAGEGGAGEGVGTGSDASGLVSVPWKVMDQEVRVTWYRPSFWISSSQVPAGCSPQQKTVRKGQSWNPALLES